MGIGIAQAFAMKEYQVKVLLVGNDLERNDSEPNMRINLNFLKEKGVLEEDVDTILSRVTYTPEVEELAANADMIFEAIVENMEVKQNLFKQLDDLCKQDTILCSNTSSLSITEIGEKATNKERIVGTHFWNPAYLIPLVEVVRTKYSTDEIIDEVFNTLQDAGKHPVRVNKDVPGFLANRLQHALFRESISIVEHGIASPAAVDEAIKYGFGMRLGIMAPFEVMDSAGLDMTKAIHEYVFPHIEDTHEAQKLVTDNIAAGRLGFKTGGHGIQDWTEEEMNASRENLNEYLINVLKALDRI